MDDYDEFSRILMIRGLYLKYGIIDDNPDFGITKKQLKILNDHDDKIRSNNIVRTINSKLNSTQKTKRTKPYGKRTGNYDTSKYNRPYIPNKQFRPFAQKYKINEYYKYKHNINKMYNSLQNIV